MLLRDNLQPTDFADAELRVSDWHDGDYFNCRAVRIWCCRCGNFWFQRHEWQPKAGNATVLDDWIFTGHYHRKLWSPSMRPAQKPEYF